jgi:hypothetical protein
LTGGAPSRCGTGKVTAALALNLRNIQSFRKYLSIGPVLVFAFHPQETLNFVFVIAAQAAAAQPRGNGNDMGASVPTSAPVSDAPSLDDPSGDSSWDLGGDIR